MIFCLYFYNPRVGINENCKYFTAASIYNNIESGYPHWTPTVRVEGLDKETIYFNFRLDIGITNFHEMDEFAPIRDCTLSMWEGGPEGFCGGHEIF